MLTCKPSEPGRLECKIDLTQLLETETEYKNFTRRWPEFLKSDPYNDKVYQLKDNSLCYYSEELIPEETNDRPPLLLLLGNPASHSVDSRMFFAFEKNADEHRFWRLILQPAGVLNFGADDNISINERNNKRRKQILQLKYKSPYRVGLSVFISMPSGASDERSGVAGIQWLLGARAMRKLEREEKKRILASINRFMPNGGTVVAFQSNAWSNLKLDDDPDYSRKIVNATGMTSEIDGTSGVRLICVPPTRLSHASCNILRKSLRGSRYGVIKVRDQA